VPDFFAICRRLPAPRQPETFTYACRKKPQTITKSAVFKLYFNPSQDSSQKAHDLPKGCRKEISLMIKTAILMTLLLLAPAALAQDMERRAEVFGSLGGGRVYEDEGVRGNGLEIGGGVGYRITPRFSVEGQVSGVSYKRDFRSGVRFEGTAVFVTGDVLFHFSTSKVQPYALFGMGLSHDKRRSQFPGVEFSPQPTVNGLAMRFGAGVKIFLNKKYSLRPEFGFAAGSNEGTNQNFEQFIAVGRASLAFTYHW
jgi:hypothetical protein